MKKNYLTGLGLTVALAASAQQQDSTAVAPRDTSYTNLKTATVTTTRLVFVTRKDTVVYDMDALDATKADLLGDMINKMPGLEMRSGALYFRGRAVNRLLVNGTDFVRGNVTKALESIPAYIIKQVKAYEDKTEQAKITGIDDGVREQVVNVVLKREYMGTWTGNADLGGGTDERWRIRGFANTFTDNFRATVYGGFTNTGQYQSASSNGDWGDNGGAGSSSGNTKYMQPGLSFMWQNKSEVNTPGYVKVDASGGWDWRGHKDYGYNENETFLGDGTSKYAVSDNHSRNDEKIWRASAYLTWQPTKTTHIEFSPSYSNNHQTDRTYNRSGTWSVPVYERYAGVLDSLEAHLADGWPATGGVNSQFSLNGYNRQTHYASSWLWATQRLTASNLRLSLRSSSNYTYATNDKSDLTRYRYYQPTDMPMDPLYNRYTTSSSHYTYTQNFLDLNIPAKFLETLRLTYGFTFSTNDSDNRGFRLERLGGVFADYEAYVRDFGMLPVAPDWQLLARDADITDNSDFHTQRHWAELQFQYNKHGLYASLQNTLRAGYDRLDYAKGDFEPLHPKRNVTEYTFHPNLRYETDSIGKFQLDYQFDVTPQSIYNDITLPDNSDPLNVRLGNPGMPDRRNHSLNFRYDRTFKNNRFYSMNASWQVTKNNVVSRSAYDKTTGVTTTQPTTINGYWNAGYSVSYGGAIDRKQLITLSTSLGYNASNAPSYTLATDGVPLRRSDLNHNVNVRAYLYYRWGKLNGNVGGWGNYLVTHSSEAISSNRSRWNASYSALVQYTFPLDFKLRTWIDVRHRTGVSSQTVDRFRPLWNANLSKTFLRDKSLMVLLEASDILNRRDQSWAYVNTSGRGSGYVMTVSRFVMLHLVYSFSTKKK